MHCALVKILTRASKGNFCLSAFTMHRHHHLTFAALLTFMMIETAPAVGYSPRRGRLCGDGRRVLSAQLGKPSHDQNAARGRLHAW
jgi:hypothetical protein